MTMFILRGCKYLPNPTNKPDGMMVSASGWWTSNKEKSKLFDTAAEAGDFYRDVCLPLWAGNGTERTIVYVVAVETRPVADTVSKDPYKQLN